MEDSIYDEDSNIYDQFESNTVTQKSEKVDDGPASEQIDSTENVSKHAENDEHEHEVSIYETQASGSKEVQKVEVQESQAQNYIYSPSDKKLCFIYNDVDSLPTEIIYQFGLKTLILDISFNEFSDLRDIHQFPHLEELICDNNLISENSHFPKLEKLKILSVNKNKITNIHIFIDKVKAYFPNLTYLSLLGNVACPNQLIDSTKDDYDYSKYRKYVLFRLKNLKFLDSYEVTQQERDACSKEQLFYDVVKAKDSSGATLVDKTEEPATSNEYTPLPQADKNQDPQGLFGTCRYMYYGKQSEGNRFIKNDDL